MKKQLLLPILCIFLFTTQLKASHLVGGQIRWECLNNGKYVFYMEIYRECTGISFNYTNQSLQILNSSFPAIRMYPDLEVFNFYGNGNISHKSLNGHQKNCSNDIMTSYSDLGAMQLFPYKSDTIKLTGVPPTDGWVFYWTSCCRPSSAENLYNPSAEGYGLRSVMYSYAGKNTYPCFDSSPEFYEMPNTSVAINSKYYFSMAAKDADTDSLMYYFDDALDNSASGNSFIKDPVFWKTGYSKTSPFPNKNQHQDNIPVKLDSNSGHLSGKIVYPYLVGYSYVYSIRVDSYREGIKIASVWRDVSLQTHEHDSNYKSPSFHINGITSRNYSLTIEAGDSINIPIELIDSNLYPDTNHNGVIRSREVAIQYSGDMFSTNLSNDSQCVGSLTPCATIFPKPIYDTIFNNYISRDSSSLNINFLWNTRCDILDSSNGKRSTFLFKLMDDQVPPEISYATLNVNLNRYKPEIHQMGNVLNVAAADSYKWFYNDSLIPNSDSNSITIQASGKYSIEVVKNGCPSKLVSYNLFTVGLEDRTWFEKIKLYPNPFNQLLTIELPSSISKRAVLTLRDLSGREITIKSDCRENRILIDTSEELPSGIYFLNIRIAENSINRKIIKI